MSKRKQDNEADTSSEKLPKVQTENCYSKHAEESDKNLPEVTSENIEEIFHSNSSDESFGYTSEDEDVYGKLLLSREFIRVLDGTPGDLTKEGLPERIKTFYEKFDFKVVISEVAESKGDCTVTKEELVERIKSFYVNGDFKGAIFEVIESKCDCRVLEWLLKKLEKHEEEEEAYMYIKKDCLHRVLKDRFLIEFCQCFQEADLNWFALICLLAECLEYKTQNILFEMQPKNRVLFYHILLLMYFEDDLYLKDITEFVLKAWTVCQIIMNDEVGGHFKTLQIVLGVSMIQYVILHNDITLRQKELLINCYLKIGCPAHHQMTDGRTALHLMVQLKMVNLINRFIEEFHMCMDLKDKFGRTPLHYVNISYFWVPISVTLYATFAYRINEKCKETFTILQQVGADLSVKDEFGFLPPTPLQTNPRRYDEDWALFTLDTSSSEAFQKCGVPRSSNHSISLMNYYCAPVELLGLLILPLANIQDHKYLIVLDSVMRWLANKISKKRPELNGCWVERSGGVAEGTAVGQPDEVDYMVHFPVLDKSSNVIGTTGYLETLKDKKSFHEGVDRDLICQCLAKLPKYLKVYVEHIVDEKMYFRFPGENCKDHYVKVDFVQMISVASERCEEMVFGGMKPKIKEHHHKNGCLIKLGGWLTKLITRGKTRFSFSHLELKYMQLLPKVVLQAYANIKHFRLFPQTLKKCGLGHINKTSYFIKNVLFITIDPQYTYDDDLLRNPSVLNKENEILTKKSPVEKWIQFLCDKLNTKYTKYYFRPDGFEVLFR